ncbi:hypothetical protein HG537_0A06160 [Torulaspora globosa]|uniref:Vacuolar protein sorting-associated protein 29 n=1 Tax=Torulaspora globosa TaxID=48254 RepID=A0A7H9HM35_9SACH|nr:hypothetical protein HG537_0A06160 [Torulaspora sp. CBS 2947]
MLILALSDAHIPDRAIDLPAKFKKLLSVPNKISQVVLLGNCTKSYTLLKFINDISPNITIVRGEFDNTHLPTTKKNRAKESIPITTVLKQGNFKIGCCSGYTVVPKNDPLSLLALARQLDVDVMLWGGTQNVEAYTLENKFFVNPGSCTGAFNSDWPIINDEELTVNNPDQNKPEDLKSSDVNGSNVPSFCLLDIQDSVCTLYIYIYIDGEVKVDRVVFKKESQTGQD